MPTITQSTTRRLVDVSELSLSNKGAVHAALAALLAHNRLEELEYSNMTTGWTAQLVLMQGLDEMPGNPPSGYVRDTALLVGGRNVTAKTIQNTKVDPSLKCQPTRLKCSAHLKNDRTGREIDFTHPDQVAPEGSFWWKSWFGIQDGRAGKLEAMFVSFDAEGETYTQFIELVSNEDGSVSE